MNAATKYVKNDPTIHVPPQKGYRDEYNHKSESRISIKKILTSGIVGLGGGVAIATFIPMGAIGFIILGILGSGVTDCSEYLREKRRIN